MLKKTGIIVSVVATAAIGLGGLAFAHEAPHPAPTNITNTQDGNVGNDCDFGQDGPLVAQDLTSGDSGVAGAANPVIGLVAPITAQTQALNCTNAVSSSTDNTDSGNTVREYTRSETIDSGNTD